MKRQLLAALLFSTALALAPRARGAELDGLWKAEFDTQIGLQKYTFELASDGGKVAGKAVSEIAGERRETELREGRQADGVVTFWEMLDFQGNSLRIDYAGKLSGDEIRFRRKVGDVAEEEFTAKREGAAKKGSLETVRLYDGPAPGSEEWTHAEREIPKTAWGGPVVCNVVNPTLTVVRPDPSVANGAAVVICPGGGFFLLSINSEGMDVAKWLAERGVACFVLRYRLVETKTDDPALELMSRGNIDPFVKPIVPLAMADGQAAIGHVRKNAAKYGVDPKRIGIMGFSAGGTVASSVGFNYTPATRPDFVAPIYLAYAWTIKDQGVPNDAPPMFILAATDDPLGLASHSLDLYRDWTGAKKSAELHLLSRGGHGFGMNKQNLPTDTWIERFAEWMGHQGLLKK